MSEEDEDVRYRWMARIAYAVLGITLLVGLWRRLPSRPDREIVQHEKSPDEIFGVHPPELPLVVSPNASRIVRWCTVRRVLERRCHRCHGAPTQFSAPFSLFTYADTQRDYPLGSGQPILRRMSHAIRYRVMPPVALPLEPPVEPLNEAERDILLSWLEEGGMALGGEDCDSPTQRRHARPR